MPPIKLEKPANNQDDFPPTIEGKYDLSVVVILPDFLKSTKDKNKKTDVYPKPKIVVTVTDEDPNDTTGAVVQKVVVTPDSEGSATGSFTVEKPSTTYTNHEYTIAALLVGTVHNDAKTQIKKK